MKYINVFVFLCMAFVLHGQTESCSQIKILDDQENVAQKESIERQKRRKYYVQEAKKEATRRKSAIDEEVEAKIAIIRLEATRKKATIDNDLCDF